MLLIVLHLPPGTMSGSKIKIRIRIRFKSGSTTSHPLRLGRYVPTMIIHDTPNRSATIPNLGEKNVSARGI